MIHFTENLSFPHLFQPRYYELHPEFRLRSKWHHDYFGNTFPITLELGCGKGEFTVGLAQKYPERNFIGIDLKGARLWRGCKTVEEKQLRNVGFIRGRADHIHLFFNPGEISEIWITFPDPQPGKERKRLTSPGFLNLYRQTLTPQGIVHLKTDDTGLFSYTLDVIATMKIPPDKMTTDLYHTHRDSEAASIQTYYESIWLSKEKKIGYLAFRV